MLPPLVTRAQLETELPAITAWADKYGWRAEVEPASRLIEACIVHPAIGAQLALNADCAGYPSVAPAWRFTDQAGGSPKSAFPAPGARPGINGSIFHSNGLICAPWNRLAYKELGGVHDDWGAMTCWKTAAPGYTQALTIADMLHAIRLHLLVSPGMMT